MKHTRELCGRLGFWAASLARDVKGQDLIEYALMAGFVAVATAALIPSVTTGISTVFSQITSVMTAAAAS